MAYLDLNLMNVKSAEIAELLSQIQWAINVMTKDNFPNGLKGDDVILPSSLSGTAIKSGTLSGSALRDNSFPATAIPDYSLPLKKLNWQEYPIALVIPYQPASTTSSLDCGGFFLYDPVKFPDGSWYLEATMKATAGTATAQLKNKTTVIGSVSTTGTDWTLSRSSALTMPSSQAALTVTLTSNSTSNTAYLWAARLIYVPN